MLNDPLLEPFTLGHLTLKNRIFSSSHAPGFNVDGVLSERTIAYQEEKAKGGLGLTMIGGSSNVSPDSESLWGQIYFGDDAIIDPLTELVDRVHSYGTAIMCQITHMGRRNVSNEGHWLPTVAPSPIREPMHRAWPKEMEKSDIERIVADFAAAAVRARTAGLDGLEICATSHLVDQFWTPLSNRRTDEYGGSLENRLRFTFEVIDSIRQVIGSDLLLGLRMIADEDQIGGLSREESAEIAQILATSGSLDFLNITGKTLATEEGLADAIPSSGTPQMPFVPLAASIKEVIDIPVLHAARINDLSSARHAISNGLIDLAGMTRAHMADPHIVNKLERGDEDRIRVCVGASLCMTRVQLGLDAACIQNPAMGREEHIPQLVPRSEGPSKKAVVVGAGPAGLEASRVLAERGHHVVLFEAQDRVGGQVVLAGRASERQSELLGIVGWLESELTHLDVAVRLNTPVDADDIAREEPDVVIIATGGWPDTSFLTAGEDLVLTSWDVLGGHGSVDGSVLIFDDNGAEHGPSVAEFLAGKGLPDIELVTPDRLVAQDLTATVGSPYLRMLYENDVKMTTDHFLVRVEKAGDSLRAILRNVFTRQEAERIVDAVVTEHGVIPNGELYFELRDRSSNEGVVDIAALIAGEPQPTTADAFSLYRVGDAVASRGIAAALYETRRLCQTV